LVAHKNQGWLCNIPTKDCAMGGDNDVNEKNFLDLSLLLPKKGGNDMGYYCNCGPTGYDMEQPGTSLQGKVYLRFSTLYVML
jgi:hypothetical protein